MPENQNKDRAAGATGDCSGCQWWKRKKSPRRGQLIPGGYGKCTRPQGHCSPEKVR
ncbi:MAG: hypothetical protein ACYC6G_14070 [Desulfobaccales bacterium]